MKEKGGEGEFVITTMAIQPMRTLPRIILIAAMSLAMACPARAGEYWPQAAGPDGNWQAAGEAPAKWSVTRGENIRWRTPMPEAGMSSVTVWGDRVFVTTHVPIKALEEKESVKDIIGFCLDANNGRILWQVQLPGSVRICSVPLAVETVYAVDVLAVITPSW